MKNKLFINIFIISIIILLCLAMIIFGIYDLKISKAINNNDIYSNTKIFRSIFNSIGYNVLALPIFFTLTGIVQIILLLNKKNKYIYYYTLQSIVLLISLVITFFYWMHGEPELKNDGIVNIVTGIFYSLIMIGYIFWFKKYRFKDLNFIKEYLLKSLKMVLFLIITFVIVNVFKVFFGRNRPRDVLFKDEKFFYAFQPNFNHIRGYSFPSGHTISTCSLISLLFLFNKKDKKYWTSTFIIFSIIFLVGISRIFSLAHFCTDVTFSILVAFITYISIERWFIPQKLVKYINLKKLGHK